MVFAIFSVLELIYDKSLSGYFWHKINKRGWFLIIIAFVSVAFNFYKDIKSEFEQIKADEAKTKSDSLFRASQNELLQFQILSKELILKKVDSTYINSIKASNEALAKYNLEITDSLNSVINKLKLDATNPQLTIVPLTKGRHSPAWLDKNEEGNNLCIQFTSKGGTSYNISLKYYLVKQTNFEYSILNSGYLFMGESFIIENTETTPQVSIQKEFLEYDEIIVFLTGSFSKDPNGKNIVPFDYAFKFNFKENKWITHWDMRYEKFKERLNIK